MTVTLVPRLELATRKPMLFLRCVDGSLSAYTHGTEGEYRAKTLDYYRDCTRALDPADPQAVRLVAFWASMPGDVAYRVRQRLPRQS